jgi:hypothetical protein
MRPFRQVRILRKYWDTIAAEVSCNVTDDGDQMMALSTKSAASDSEKNPRRGPPEANNCKNSVVHGPQS